MQLKLKDSLHPLTHTALRVGLLATAAAGLVACSHAQPQADSAADKTASSQKPQDAAKAEQDAADYRAQGQADLDAALAKLRGVSVFFAFDDATLTKEATDRLADVGAILVRHADLKVKIEGNADERGTEQYNLALGQRRAEAVKKYLARLGVQAAQVAAVSFGAEKPVDPGHNEEAWKKNRRADVDPQKKK
jgi:peptidoglycan-associated lipoprotein